MIMTKNKEHITLNDKRILVTGSPGFIGANLCKHLVEEGNQVYCLDNFYTGSREHVFGKLIEHDIIEPIDPSQFEDGLDEIYNLACPASPPHYQKDPIFTTKTCVFGALNVLDLARKFNARILQASTSEVYGEPLENPQNESYRGNVNCHGIRSCYDEGKRCAESIFFDHHRMFGTKIKVIRIFNTYGEMMDANDGRVVSNFITQALAGKDLTIYGDGSQTRSICYVADLVEGIIRMMRSPEDFLGPVNLGNPEEYSVKDLAEKIKQLTKSESKLVYRELPSDDPTQRRPDISLAKEKLDWQPRIDSTTGLKKTIEFFSTKINS